LAKVDPNRFGIAVATVDGHVYASGDADDEFTIQSISKPFVYGMALDDQGPEDVLRRVGVEPSGDAFNSIVMDEVNKPSAQPDGQCRRDRVCGAGARRRPRRPSPARARHVWALCRS
jgi:glutaminase